MEYITFIMTDDSNGQSPVPSLQSDLYIESMENQSKGIHKGSKSHNKTMRREIGGTRELNLAKNFTFHTSTT